MRKVVVSEFVSLDGVVENPQWTISNFVVRKQSNLSSMN